MIHLTEGGEHYDTVWLCPPPEQGVRYQVSDQQWSWGYRTRFIRSVVVEA